MKKQTLKALAATLLISAIGCTHIDDPIASESPVEVTVRSQDGQPVEGAVVEGGIDWDFYRVRTDAAGRAILPGSARGEPAAIYRTDFLPIAVPEIHPTAYILNKTAKRLDPIGAVAGKVIRFGQGELSTLDYGGTYHLYMYGDHAVTEVFTRRLHDSASAIRETQWTGDTLWLTTHDSGLFVFSLRNPSSPQFLFRLSIPGYLGPFAVKDSILVLGDQWQPGPLRIVAFNPNGAHRDLARVGNYFVRKMARIGNTVALLGNNESLPTVFDISNPSAPRLLYNGLEWQYRTGFFYDRLAILAAQYGYGGESFRLDFKVLDLSNPENPVPLNTFTADSYIAGLASENWAYGNYYAHSQTTSVLSGSISTGFHTVATVSEGSIDGVAGALPPYYVIANRLWRLVDR